MGLSFASALLTLLTIGCSVRVRATRTRHASLQLRGATGLDTEDRFFAALRSTENEHRQHAYDIARRLSTSDHAISGLRSDEVSTLADVSIIEVEYALCGFETSSKKCKKIDGCVWEKNAKACVLARQPAHLSILSAKRVAENARQHTYA